MQITFKWSIKKLEVAPALNNRVNVVTTVNWNVVGTDSDSNISESYSGLSSFSLGDTFVSYDQLTEQQVLDWCFEPEINEVKNFEGTVISTSTRIIKDEGEAQVTKQIEELLAQKAITPDLPWA